MLTWVKNILTNAQVAEERKRLWDARVAALEQILGKCDGTVWRPSSQLRGLGFADVLRFREYAKGIAYVTCGLIGVEKQIPNRWGQYELMMCLHEEDEWAPALLSRLAQYTHEATLQPGDVMDLAQERHRDSTIEALLFGRLEGAVESFDVLGTPSHLILAVGITAAEFVACKDVGSGVMLRMLKEKGVYPFTQLHRESVT